MVFSEGALRGPESCLFTGEVKVAKEKTSLLFHTWSHKACSLRDKPASMVALTFHTVLRAVSLTKADQSLFMGRQSVQAASNSP